MKDVFENKYYIYIVMECVQGGELFEYIKNNIVSEREALLIIYQMLEALQYLHMCGIVHRDLKPENVLVEINSQGQSQSV